MRTLSGRRRAGIKGTAAGDCNPVVQRIAFYTWICSARRWTYNEERKKCNAFSDEQWKLPTLQCHWVTHHCVRGSGRESTHSIYEQTRPMFEKVAEHCDCNNGINVLTSGTNSRTSTNDLRRRSIDRMGWLVYGRNYVVDSWVSPMKSYRKWANRGVILRGKEL